VVMAPASEPLALPGPVLKKPFKEADLRALLRSLGAGRGAG
jgi:hypothetical protein